MMPDWAPYRWQARRSDPVWVFLVGRRFVTKTPGYEGWISLDLLGFSRPNLDFSKGYEEFSLN
jgi:hypothetical protein